MGVWLVLMLGTGAGVHLRAAPSTALLLLCLAGLPYGLLLARRAGPDLRVALGLAAAVGIVLVLSPVAFSDDLYRFLWDAKVGAAGIDPYRYAPADPALAELRDPLWRRINHPTIATIYPPLAQALFRVADGLGHAPWSPKLIALLGHLGVGVALSRLAPGRRSLPTAYLLNPLALSESALGGHIDVFVGLAVLGFAAALVRRRMGLAALLVGAASGLKLVGLALAPLMVRSRWVVVALALALLPFVWLHDAGGPEARSGLGEYARRWRGSPGAFVLAEGAMTAVVRAAGEPVGTRVRFEGSLGDLAQRLDGSALDPRASFRDPKKPIGDAREFEVHVVAGALARVLCGGIVLLLALALGWRRAPPARACRWVLLAALLLAPQIHPWYLLWLLPLELWVGSAAGVVWSLVALASYAPLDRWLLAAEWSEAGPLGSTGIAQQVLVLAVLVAEARRVPEGPSSEHPVCS